MIMFPVFLLDRRPSGAQLCSLGVADNCLQWPVFGGSKGGSLEMLGERRTI